MLSGPFEGASQMLSGPTLRRETPRSVAKSVFGALPSAPIVMKNLQPYVQFEFAWVQQALVHANITNARERFCSNACPVAVNENNWFFFRRTRRQTAEISRQERSSPKWKLIVSDDCRNEFEKSPKWREWQWKLRRKGRFKPNWICGLKFNFPH